MIYILHCTIIHCYFPPKLTSYRIFWNYYSTEPRVWLFSHCYNTQNTIYEVLSLPVVPVAAATEGGASQRPLITPSIPCVGNRLCREMCADGCSFCALLSTSLHPSKRTCASSWLLPWLPGSWHRWSGPQLERPPQMSPRARESNAGGQSHHACDAEAHHLVFEIG